MADLPRPRSRLRRLRRTPALRALVRETSVDPGHLVQPIFVREDPRTDAAIPSMPGISRLTIDEAVSETEQLAALGLPAVILFGLPTDKDPLGQAAYAEHGVVQEAIRAIKEAADSVPRFGDRRTYQKDPANLRESLREIALDLEEGADIVMVKPALAYLDVIRAARERFDAPLAAFSVSGEYSLIKAAAERGWVDERPVVEETLTAIHRAGADLILTYHAKAFATWQREARA